MAKAAQTLTLAQAAALLGRSERFVGNLRERGYVEMPEPGAYPLVGLARGVVAYFEDLIARNEDTTRQAAATDARTREIELRIQRRAADLILAHDVIDMLDQMIAMVSAEFKKLPTRATRNLHRRREMREEVERILSRLTEQRDRLVAEIKEG